MNNSHENANLNRTLQRIIPSVATSDGGGVKLRRSLGQNAFTRLDPFLMLDEFSSTQPDEYLAGFPSHPHRGFETVTYMLAGHLLHEDHLGNRGDLKSGGAQWMTAGRGIIHSEMPQQTQGQMRGFQLWINLPAKEKMKPASYQDIQPEQIPIAPLANGGNVKIISGNPEIAGQTQLGAIQGISTSALILDVHLPAGGYFEQTLNPDDNALIYPYEAMVSVGTGNHQSMLKPQTAGVLSAGNRVEIFAGDFPANFLLLAARPLNEPIVQYGPFVMNTQEEIEQAVSDYKNGTLTN